MLPVRVFRTSTAASVVLTVVAVLGLQPQHLLFVQAQTAGCSENCQNSCAQSSFTACTVNCTNTVAGSVDTCQAASFAGASTVTCAKGGCQNAFAEGGTTLACSGDDSCLRVQTNQSTVECTGDSCNNAQFHTSAIYCEPYSACSSSWYFTCSCCDGYSSNCGGQPSCEASDFCSNTFLGRTCKEWGNPACADVAVTETGVDVRICDGGNCANAALTGNVLCDNKNSAAATAACQGAQFSDALAACDAGACQRSTFVDTTVGCWDSIGEASCLDSEFRRTTANCYDDSCDNAIFVSSAVNCDPYSACSGSTYFLACTCCDGYASNCDGASSCTANPTSFCSSTFLGRTCKEWGNPICENYDIPASGNPEVTECRGGNCVSGNYNGEAIWCDNKNNVASVPTCQSSTFTNSRVECEAGSCQTSTFFDSEVRCLDTTGENSCDKSIFNQTSVACYDDACDSSDFYASKTYCSAYSACSSSGWFACSCCDGYECGNRPSCEDDPIGFCSSTYLGRTCKDWGNPVCDSITVDESIVSADVIICDKGNCASSTFTADSVFCNNKNNAAIPATCDSVTFQEGFAACIAGACQNSDFTATEVACFAGRDENDNSCDGSTFRQSTVACYEDGCDNSIFEASEVLCSSYSSCGSATFDDCSCCDGNGCLSGIPSCTNDPVGFCSGREINGVTCAVLGNPICRGLGGPTSPPVAPTAPSPPVGPPPTADTSGTPAPVEAPVAAPTPTDAPASDLTNSPTSLETDSPTILENDSPTSTETGPPTQIETGAPAMVDPIPTTAGPVTMSPTGVTECGVNEVTAISGQPVTIPPCIDGGGKTTVTTWPRNGSLTVRENGSVVYVPNPGFVGQDIIEVETCSASGNCFEVTMNVEVVEQEELRSPDGGGGGTAALAALAVIPVAGIGYWLYKKKQSNMGDSQGQLSGPSFKEGASLNVSTVNQSVDGPSFPTYEEAREPQQVQQQQQQQQQDQAPQQAGRQSGRQSGGGYLPTVKDQAQSVDRPASITASVQSDGDGRASTASRQRQDPPSDPPAASPTATAKPMANAASQGYMPDVKDQCRNVPLEEMNADPPLAAAIILEDTVDQPPDDIQRLDEHEV